MQKHIIKKSNNLRIYWKYTDRIWKNRIIINKNNKQNIIFSKQNNTGIYKSKSTIY